MREAFRFSSNLLIKSAVAILLGSMILLTSMLHREELKNIIFHWMTNKLSQDDCVEVKKIINFNVYAINLYLDALCEDMFSYLSKSRPWTFEVTSKGDLKSFILKVAPYRNERLEYIKGRCRRFPEDFYLNSPFHGKVYCIGPEDSPVYLGHSRIKRFRRIAEKASRRMIEIIFEQVKKRADDLAMERASRLGIPKEHLFTPIEQQVEEFAHAERRFIKELKRGMFYPEEQVLRSARIHDVAGVKVILEDSGELAFEAFFKSRPGFKILEKERHTGVYNAVNYIIECSLDKGMLEQRLPDARVVNLLASRGLDADRITEDYRSFIASAEESVMVEIISSSYPEMIESELGRCMHEDRILAQRESLEYRSSIARNVRYITEYMFLFALSGKACLDRLPIKLWEKVMPDTYDHAIRALWDIPTMPVL
jgi:hypothetical protein